MKLKRKVVENNIKNNVVELPVVAEEPKLPDNFEVINTENIVLDALLERAREMSMNCNDYNVVNASPENLRFNDNAGITYIDEFGNIHESPISHYALGQLGTKIGVPARYLEKCVATGRIDLAQDNVNSWLDGYNKDLFIREYMGGIRGVLSSKYSVCDTDEILRVVDDTVDLHSYKIKGSFLNPERLHVRLVSKEMLPIDGEDLFAGLFIDSSDVGRNMLTVQFGIYKQVCTNGLVVSRAGGILFQQKHIGITIEEFHEGLRASLKNVSLLTDNAIEWVKLAKSKKMFGGNKNSAVSKEDMEEFIARIRSTTMLSEESATKVLNLMQTKYDTTKWGFINGITEVAQDFTLEKRLDLERIAGNLLVA